MGHSIVLSGLPKLEAYRRFSGGASNLGVVSEPGFLTWPPQCCHNVQITIFRQFTGGHSHYGRIKHEDVVQRRTAIMAGQRLLGDTSEHMQYSAEGAGTLLK